MANNQEMYCNHCGTVTTFYLNSDLIWECDDCENPYGSIPRESTHSHVTISCPHCDEMLDEDDLEDGDDRCPHCGEVVQKIDMNNVHIVCEICGESVTSEELGNDNICPSCGSTLYPSNEPLNDGYFKCKYCNNVHHIAELVDDTFCPTCMEEIDVCYNDDEDEE